MSRITLLESLNKKNGIAKLIDQSAFRLAPDQMDRAAEWTPGTEIIVQETDGEPWKYKLLSSGGGLPVRAEPYSPGA